MKNILIYKQGDDLNITHFVDSLDIEAVHEQAQKMLPFGVLYRVGTIDEIPQDRTFRAAWDIEDSDLNDGIGGETNTKQLLSNSKQLLSSRQEQLESFENNLKTLETELEELSGEHASLNNLATEKEKVWTDTKDSAFAAKAEWEEKLSAAENAEKIVIDKGEEASEEEKQSAVDLRKIAEDAFKAQDELFNNKREAADARLQSDQFVEKLNNHNNKINEVKFSIVDSNSLVAEAQATVSTHQQNYFNCLVNYPQKIAGAMLHQNRTHSQNQSQHQVRHQKPRRPLMIKINLNKAKEIVHSFRRAAREKEFEPHDNIIMKQIPGNDATEAEKSRAEIRARYADMQTRVDQADNIETLKEIIDTCQQ